MGFIAKLLEEVFSIGKPSGPDPSQAAAEVKKAADAADALSIVDQEKLDAAARTKKRTNRDTLTIDPGLAGMQEGTGLQIPGVY